MAETRKEIVLHGLAAVFNELGRGDDHYYFFAPGCFLDSIRNDNVTMQIGHDDKKKFASTAAGNLMLCERAWRGLYFECIPNFLPAGREAIELVRSGRYRFMSVGFTVLDCEVLIHEEPELRKITRARLWEISLADRPVFKGTTVKVREDEIKTVDPKPFGKIRLPEPMPISEIRIPDHVLPGPLR